MGNLPIPYDLPLGPPASPHTRDHFSPSAILISRSPSARTVSRLVFRTSRRLSNSACSRIVMIALTVRAEDVSRGGLGVGAAGYCLPSRPALTAVWNFPPLPFCDHWQPSSDQLPTGWLGRDRTCQQQSSV